MIWLIADTHIHHANIIKYCNRPFPDVDTMDQVIIENWNRKIGPEDTVYHLGDVILARKDLLIETIFKLNGKKYLIRGNHDKDVSEKRFKEAGFIEVYKDPIVLSEYGIILSHIPILSTSGYFNVHGHTHNSDPLPGYPFYSKRTHLCISMEMTDYSPMSLDSVLEVIRNAKGKEG